VEDEVFSIATLRQMPLGDVFIELISVNSDELFARFAEKQILAAIRQAEENPKYLQNSTEDEITNNLITFLRGRGLYVEHDPMVGGHVDILMRHKSHKWMAEAKIFDNRGYGWLLKGMVQLTTRYLSARDRNCALIVYTFRDDPAKTMSNLKTRLSGTKRFICIADWDQCSLSYYVTLTHPRTGREARVLNTIACLHWKPEA
jgi:hypothetical protein